MSSTSSIPQEIFDHIIDEARNDKETLNACSLVSRSFLPTSRKNLFYMVTVNSKATSQALRNLLFSKPAIVDYIRELTIVPHPKRMQSMPAGTPWVVRDQNLASILSTLPRVRQLQIGDHTSYLFDWNYFPPAIQLALRAQVHRLSDPSALKIFRISELPALLFFAPIKQLSLFGVNIAFTDTDLDTPEGHLLDSSSPMAQLESLDVSVYDFRETPNIAWPLLFRCAPNLRHLAVLSSRNGGDYGFCIAQQLIEVAAASLNSFAYLVYDDDLHPLLEYFRWPQLNLGTISNLTTLSFTFTSLSMNENPHNFNAVIGMLKDSSVTRHLETLTFAFEMTYATCMWESRVILLSRYSAWVDFNRIFQDGPGIPTLRNLRIYLYLTQPPLRAADAKLQSLLITILTALGDQVMLLCKTYGNID